MKKSAILISIILGIAVICSAVIFSISTNYVSEKAVAQVSTIELNTNYNFIPTVNSMNNGTSNFSIPFSENAFSLNFTYNGNQYNQNCNRFEYSYNQSTGYKIRFVANAFVRPYYYIEYALDTSNNFTILYRYFKSDGTDEYIFNTSINNFNCQISFITLTPSSSISQNALNFWNTFKNGNLKLMLTPADYYITWNIIKGSGSPSELTPNTTTTLQITPNMGYGYPLTISYVGTAADIQYYDETGEIVITNPTSGFTIEAVCFSYYDQGYQTGYDEGKTAGISIGYDQGYVAGEDAAINNNIISDNVTGVVSSIFSGLFGNIFAVEIFPNFPLYLFILIPTVFAVIGLLLWLIRGK